MIRLIFGFCLVFLLISNSFAVNPKAYLGKKNLPIHILADQLTAFNKKGLYIFNGNVVATRGDVKLRSDRMEVYKNLKTGEIQKIVCMGHVVITKEDKKATAKKAIYDAHSDVVKLFGNARVVSGKNNITADMIVYYLNKDYVVSQSDNSSKRVEVTIYPGKKGKK